MEASELSGVEARPPRDWVVLKVFLASAAIAAALLAAFQLYVGGVLNPDGASYADLADAILRGDFKSVVIAYWSPVYPTLIAATFALFRPAPLNELRALYGLNSVVLCLLFTLFFLLLKTLERDRPFDPGFYFVGFSSFVFCSVFMIGLPMITPDLLVAALVISLAMFLVRVSDGQLTVRSALGFGITLGFAYLTKLSLMPVGLSAILLAALVARRDRRALLLLLRTAIVFATIVAFWAVPLSILKGRPTLGDIAKLGYAWHVAMIKPWIHWSGGPPGAGLPIHPSAMLSESPRVFLFEKQFRQSTYPLWYDPSYWYEGLRVRFDLSQQIATTADTLQRLITICRPLVPVVAALLMLFVSSGRPDASRWRRVAPVLAMVAIAIGMYVLVYVERRYLGGYLALLVITLLWPLSAAPRNRVIYRVCCLVIGVSLLLPTVQKLNDDFRQRKVFGVGDHRATALALLEEGVRGQSKIAVLGEGFTAIGWARLAHVHIISDMEEEDVPRFWAAPAEKRVAILHAMRAHGVEVVISPSIRKDASLLPWRRVGSTQLFLLRTQDVP